MPLRNTAENYGSVAKFLHWSIVVLVVVQFFLAESADELPDGPGKFQILAQHKSLGMLVLLLAVARIAWKVANKGLPGPIGSGLIKKAAAAGHGLLYLLVLLQPVSGWAMTSAAGYPASLFGLFDFPALVSASPGLHEALEELHEGLFVTLVVVAAIHIAAALYHHFVLKDDVLRRMWPFGGRAG
jgi:cytochrome b561